MIFLLEIQKITLSEFKPKSNIFFVWSFFLERPVYYNKEVGIKSKTKLKIVVTLGGSGWERWEGASGVLVSLYFWIPILMTEL